MKHFEDEIRSADGLKLFVQGWRVERAAAVAALVHGHSDHTGRFAHVGAAFNSAGYSLVGFDLRGHGRSEGKRGHSPNYEALMEDLVRFLEYVGTNFSGLPVILYGHSMGGNLVLNYCIRRTPQLLGAIATSPWLKLAFEPPAAQLVVGKLMNRIYPSFSQSAGMDNAVLSRDPKVVEAYGADPLVHGRITARHYFGIRGAGLWALQHAAELSIPVLLMHGTADGLISEAASREFAQRAGAIVTYRAWDGCYHELHNEPVQRDVFRTMTEWIAERLSKQGTTNR